MSAENRLEAARNFLRSIIKYRAPDEEQGERAIAGLEAAAIEAHLHGHDLGASCADVTALRAALTARAERAEEERDRLLERLRSGIEMIRDAVELYQREGRYPAAEIEWLESASALAAATEEDQART